MVVVALACLGCRVDERLNGDGTGLPFGINDGVLGWIMVGMFTFIWVNWFIAQKDCECCFCIRVPVQ